MHQCMRDSVRLRSTPRSVCVVCSASAVSVCPFFMDGALREVSPHWPLPARLPYGRDLGSPATQDRTHALPNLCARRTRIPSHLLSPGLPGNQGRVSKVCQSLPRRPLGQRLPAVPTRAVQTNARGGTRHPSPFRAVFHRDS